MPDTQFFCQWDESDIRATHDQSLIEEAKTQNKEIEEQWQMFRQFMLKHPKVFQEKTIQQEMFNRAYGWVVTRCFDLGFGRTSMVPMGDNFNHYHYNVQDTLINKPEHLAATAESPEFIMEKYMNNYSILFQQELLELAKNASGKSVDMQLNIRGRFIKEHYEANLQFSEYDSLKKAIESTENLWDVPRLKEHWERTKEFDPVESDDDEEEEFSEEMDRIGQMLGQDVLEQTKLNVSEIKKGFAHFVRIQKKRIKMDERREALKEVKEQVD